MRAGSQIAKDWDSWTVLRGVSVLRVPCVGRQEDIEGGRVLRFREVFAAESGVRDTLIGCYGTEAVFTFVALGKRR